MTQTVDQIRRKQMSLKNEGLEADMRPGREAVVIRRETLTYYQSLEGMLNDALDLAAQKVPPVIQIAAADIQEAVEGAVAGALARLTGLVASGKPPDALENGSVMSEAPATPPVLPGHGVKSGKRWKPVAELMAMVAEDGPSEDAVWAAVYAGKIRKEGRGKAALLNTADFEKWAAAYKPKERG